MGRAWGPRDGRPGGAAGVGARRREHERWTAGRDSRTRTNRREEPQARRSRRNGGSGRAACGRAVEISRTPPPRPAGIDAGDPAREPPVAAEPAGFPFGRPREFAGGRVRVYGCSPGCLVAAVLVSLLLSCLLTALLNGF